MACESAEPQITSNEQRILCRERDPNLNAPREVSTGLSSPSFMTPWRLRPSWAKSGSKSGGAWRLELIERNYPQ